MAFQTHQTLDRFTLTSSLDPAIDAEKSDLDVYVASYGYDPRYLVFKEGQSPTLFHCRPLTHRLLSRLMDRMMRGNGGGEVEVAVHEAALLAFRHAVCDIENLPGFDAQRDVQAGNPPAIKESWLDASCLPIDVIVEIGAVVLARARLAETDRKN